MKSKKADFPPDWPPLTATPVTRRIGIRKAGIDRRLRKAARWQNLPCSLLLPSANLLRPYRLTQHTASRSASKFRACHATGYKHACPGSWQDAFRELVQYLEPLVNKGKRRVIFFDELPWLAGRNSRFLPAFEYFWNSWASRQKRLIVVVCGSAASWMIAKVLRQKGGLHNRVTLRLPLHPFTLGETEELLKFQGIKWERSQIAELYMAIGGIPFYLSLVEKGKSASQAIDDLIFAEDAPLHDEFDELYAALFEHHERHLTVVRALAKKQQGLTRGEILKLARMPSGGNLTTILDELETSGFISRIIPFGKTGRDALYRLMDEYTLFHLRWAQRGGPWTQIRGTPAWRSWSGYAFENLCFRHVRQIQAALGIAGVQVEVSAWRVQPKSQHEAGAQIDLIIDRRDDVIHLCEMKFTDAPFAITKKYAGELRSKEEVFRERTSTRKSLFLTFVTKSGLSENQYSLELVDAQVHLGALFE